MSRESEVLASRVFVDGAARFSDLLYVLSKDKWQNDGRLELHYAGAGGLDTYGLTREVEPEGFFTGADLDLPLLCKFKGTLTPERMREDLILTLAADRNPYRKHIITW